MMDYGDGPGFSGGGGGGGRGGSSAGGDGRIYVGNLPPDVREKDLEELFYKYGRIRDIELKSKRGLVPFAFVRFEDPRCVRRRGRGRGRRAAFPACAAAQPQLPRARSRCAAPTRPGGGCLLREGRETPLGLGCTAHPPPLGEWGAVQRGCSGEEAARAKPRIILPGRQP